MIYLLGFDPWCSHFENLKLGPGNDGRGGRDDLRVAYREVEGRARLVLLAVVEEVRVAHRRDAPDAHTLGLERGDRRAALQDGGDEVEHVGRGVLRRRLGVLRGEGAYLERR